MSLPTSSPTLKSSSRLTGGDVSTWLQGEASKCSLVAAAVIGEIVQGKLEIGSRLPPERELAEKLGVSYMTARAGISLLVEQGVLERQRGRGRGTFVRKLVKPTRIAAVYLDIYQPEKTILHNLLPAFGNVLKTKGLEMEIVGVGEQSPPAKAHADLVRRWHQGELKGLLIVSRYPARNMIDLIASGIPFVWIGNDLGHHQPMCSVVFDWESAFFATLPLFNKRAAASGRDLPLHIVTASNRDDWERKLHLAQQAQVYQHGPITLHRYSCIEEVTELFTTLETPSLLYISGGRFYQAILEEARKRHLRVPEDLAIIVEYIGRTGREADLMPTGWDLPFEEMAEEALKLLENAIEAFPSRLEQSLVGLKYHQGNSF